jgi:5-formyltetrahydrofolate cyclo-ligase
VEAKRLVRASVLGRRSALADADREAAGLALLPRGLDLARDASSVVAYAAVGTEPPTRPLLVALVARGTRVLLPVVSDAGGLGWGELLDWSELVPSPMGLLEPAATPQATAAAREADLLLVPAVAVDRAGHRLGRGGGYFDRWLTERPAGRIVAVVYDDEVLDEVPHEPHDCRVDAALTPGGVIQLG